MTVVFSISPSREVHDIEVETKNGRKFVIDIYRATTFAMFNADVTVRDPIPPNAGSWTYKVIPSSLNSPSIFQAALDLILQYISELDPTDSIVSVINPYNFPLVDLMSQNLALTNRNLSPMAN